MGLREDAIVAEALSAAAGEMEVLRLLEACGHEAWAVGGAVRDAMLGLPAHDLDLATAATCEEVELAATEAGLAVHRVGARFGTLTVEAPGGAAVEVTTYRADGPYRDGRHPEEVRAARTIEEDLARRDFTMNALAFHPERGVLDPYGGRDDIAARTIRCVGDPKRRFKEDGLRVLRACRFASQLGFGIEEATLEAMTSCKSMLAAVASERVAAELDGFLMGSHVGEALIELVDVLGFVLPELVAMKDCPQVTPYHVHDVLEHTAWTVQGAPRDKLVRWAALCHDMGKPASAFFDEEGIEHFYGHAKVSRMIAQGLLDRLPMSEAQKGRVLDLVARHDEAIEPSSRGVRRALARMGGDVEQFRALCQLKKADSLAHSPEGAKRAAVADELLATLEEVLAAKEAFSLRDLALSGDDVLALGVEAGPMVGRILSEALEAVIEGEVANDPGALRRFVVERAALEAGSTQ